MGSETPLRLPTIDFTMQNLKPGSAEWDSVRARVLLALEEYGCFEALFDKVPSEVRKAIFEATEELFDLPLQTKLRNVSEKPFHGYVGQYPMVPLYESMGIEEANVHGQVQNFTNILWPQQNPNFRSIYTRTISPNCMHILYVATTNISNTLFWQMLN